MIPGMAWMRIRHGLEFAAFHLILFVVKSLPVRASIQMANGLAWLVVNILPRKASRYSVAAENIRAAFGSETSDERVHELILGMWQHLFRMVCEMVQLPRHFRLQSCGDVLLFEKRDECVQAMCSGRPVIFLGGHFGNWEISVNTFGHFGFPMGVVARFMDNPLLQEWFREYRESTGNWLISKTGAGADLSAIMNSNGMASLLCDQDAGRNGLFVDFFGKPASTVKSIALLALQYNALVVVGGAWRLPPEQQKNRRWVQFCLTTQDIIDSAEFQDVNGIERLTQRFTSSLEALIRKAPEQYFWVHRRWKTPPEARRRRKAAA